MKRSRHFETICIGGGAAGLFFTSLKPDTLLVEKMEDVGKKLLLTGGGNCNFTHEASPEELAEGFYEKKNFVAPSFYAFPSERIREYFDTSLNIPSYVREDGCVFPLNKTARDVVNSLKAKAPNILTNTPVKETRRENNQFIVITDKDTFTSDNLVIATGGMSFPSTGSTGDGYIFAKSFGHKIVPPRPALCRVQLEAALADCQGITVEDVSLTLDGHTAEGSLLFTESGISGPMVMNLSRFVEGTSTVKIKFATITAKEIKSLDGKKKAINAISSYTGLPSSLIKSLLGKCGEKNIADLSKAELEMIVPLITAYRAKASVKGELKRATVTRGGVDVREINRKSFESKLVEGLYIIGEALDVDGLCGGYNLSFAFASAFAAASAISEKES